MQAKGEVSIWSPVPVYIRLNSPRDSLTIEDTVLVVVTTTSQEVDVFTMQPLPGDSTVQAAGIPGRDVSVRAYDPDGNPLTELNVAYWTSDKRVAVNYGSYFQGIDTGTVMVYAQTTAYGRTFIDSVQFRVTFPITGYFNIYPRYYLFPESDPVLSGPRLRIARGGVVTWQSQSPFPVDIVFDDPATALDPDGDGEETGGNIPVVASDPYTTAQRKFAEPGEYKFHSTAYPSIQGVVEVVP
jgi:hypothetical protein